MNTTYLIHGFNVKDRGAGTTDLLLPYLRESGHDVVEVDYPWMFRVRTRLCNDGLAMVIAELTKPGTNVIAHSNGGALTYLAAKHGARFGHVTLLNPALNEKLAIPHAKSVDVWYSPSDPWTLAAKYIPSSVWGAQGRYGFKGDDPRYTQFDADREFRMKAGHSGVLEHPPARAVVAMRHIEMCRGSGNHL